jgi:hypothetical protein
MFVLLAALLMSTAAADSRISGNEAEAIAIAVRIFKSKQGSKFEGRPVYGDLRHYTVEIERTRNRLEVTFVPDQPPLKPNEAGPGGSTIYGWEVAYVFSLNPLKMVEEHYAR